MKRLVPRKSLFMVVTALALVAGFVAGSMMHNGVTETHAAGLPYANLQSFVTAVQANHTAPFNRDSGTSSGSNALAARRGGNQTFTAVPYSGGGSNVKVNQDLNPWPKAGVAAAVDPTNGNNYVVMSNDFRDLFDHMFYHVSTDGGRNWTDDAMTSGVDLVTGFIPLSYQTDPGVAFDSFGHSYLSAMNINLIFDTVNGYNNLDSEIEVAEGSGHGRYTSESPTVVDNQPCNGTASAFNCPAVLDKPFITVDNVPGSKHYGTIYVYYTLFCLGTGSNNTGSCTDGKATVPAFSSVILESHATGWGRPFSEPALVSGAFIGEQFPDMVIDSHGTPHIFFDDYSTSSINMYESTLKGGSWTVSSSPVASFKYGGLNNGNWGFLNYSTVAPGCGIHVDTAYCAFSATKVGNGKAGSRPSVYLAVVNTTSAASNVYRVNNDPALDGKDHFFPWATATPNGNVYVGWYDNRNDDFNARVQYFVGKSTDGGKTFPKQQPVSGALFNPCVGYPGCGYFGDYTQLVSGPNGVVHAAWSDTRDGASMQIYTQSISW